MALKYLIDPNSQIIGRNGVPNVGGSVRVYYNGTDDRAPTYKDFEGTRNPFPVILNSNGQAIVIADDSHYYRVEVYTASGGLLWTVEGVQPGDDLTPYMNDLWGHWAGEGGGQNEWTFCDSSSRTITGLVHKEGNIGAAETVGVSKISLKAGLYHYDLEFVLRDTTIGSGYIKFDLSVVYGTKTLRKQSFAFGNNFGGNRLENEFAGGVFEMEEDGDVEFKVTIAASVSATSCYVKLGNLFINEISSVFVNGGGGGGGDGSHIYGSLQDAIADADNIDVGAYFETNGFHTSGDGGAARYVVSDTGTANGMDVITIATGKYALFQWSNEVTPEQLGAVGDGDTEDTAVFDYIVNYFSSVLRDMQVKRVIRGSMGKRYKVHALSVHDVCVSRCIFKGRGSTTGYGIRLGSHAIIEKCILFDFLQAIFTGDNDSAVSAVVTGCTISWCGNGICLHSGVSQQKSVDNILLENNYISRLGTLGHSSDSTPPSWDNTGCGIWLNGNWKGVSIVNNVLEYNGYTGLRLECNRTDLEPSCVVTENYFEGNKLSAIRIIMQKRPCMVSIFGNQMTKVNTNVFYTTGIYCTSVMSSGRIESPYGEYLGVATSNGGSDIISVNTENLKASNILIYPEDLTSDTFQLIPAKCANSTSGRKMLHLDVYARSSDATFAMSVSYVDKNNVTQTENVTIDTNAHQVIEIPLIDVNLYDSVNEPITCVVTSATWTYLMITDLWIK